MPMDDMPKLFHDQSAKTGLSPGSLIHVGDRITERVRITILNYDDDRFDMREGVTPEDVVGCRNGDGVTWIQVRGLHQPEILEAIGGRYGLHLLMMEDILNTGQRPKTETFESCLFTVLKSFRDRENAVWGEQISIVLGKNFVISFQESDQDLFETVVRRLKNKMGRIRHMGSDYLAYSLMDTIVDHYFEVVDLMADEIERIEERLTANPETEILEAVYQLKREILYLRKHIFPMRDVTLRLEKGDSPLIRESSRFYLRDLYDHIIQITDTIETFRETATSLLELYHTSVSNRMNEVMKVLTIISTIFIPLSFLAGVYGMNFKYMPELEFRWSYGIFWFVILVAAGAMILYFRRKKWF
ncbi:magnesium/cobalt transporter CorA [Desulfococcus multivorans]|uniref:Magnesium transport protein CorA n=1 Tax=Desulfococcus multivorans DSM 2059 TaxID=1121405 RepID=S7TQ00_DESML|nr:magnesium/cobalt transporter CorA [Desulfococcus multivorans]AQV02860.2 magnesium and cobalt transport protein CorA [Desulfococcus multivorans]EPR39277.1 magnesium and cobalt transport protein CorA [Desulfococcus multivorans DSM 2059]MDX9817858.1 magnesium/cobalt transporter CorA [Desulfococcus multivorans]SKA11932.1 magnesium transporter [Desulfococcus multivorans DSM 2059]